jgi:phosphoribosylaminoimidazole-succinocarboxamide synthase
MVATLETTLALPLLARGKVRDTYELGGGELLMVATDRISAFDVVLPTPIPDKGRVLTQLSAFWFARTAGLVPNHVAPMPAIPAELLAGQPDLPDRAMRVLRADPIPFECVVRGYLSGSGWKDYLRTGGIAGETGHDENISRRDLADRVGGELATRLERVSLSLYRAAVVHAESRGLILADTKLEFGWRNGQLILIDELFTPDSSRYWDLARYRPAGAQPSYDKQFVRDYVETLGWDKRPPGPTLPEAVVEGTRSRYLAALELLTQ